MLKILIILTIVWVVYSLFKLIYISMCKVLKQFKYFQNNNMIQNGLLSANQKFNVGDIVMIVLMTYMIYKAI